VRGSIEYIEFGKEFSSKTFRLSERSVRIICCMTESASNFIGMYRGLYCKGQIVESQELNFPECKLCAFISRLTAVDYTTQTSYSHFSYDLIEGVSLAKKKNEPERKREGKKITMAQAVNVIKSSKFTVNQYRLMNLLCF
jgi:hypothetical protein